MEATDSPKQGSAFARMFNVLASPEEVFNEIKERPVEHSNWIWPAIIWSLIGIICVELLFSQEWALHEIQKGQEKAMEAQVAAGKMTQAQADQATQWMGKFMPIMMKVGGVIVQLIMAFGVPFFWGFILWLVGVRFFKADFEYMKGVEAAGLAMIIYLIAGVIGILFSFAMGKLSTISAAFFLPEFDFTRKSHFALGALNPFYLWFAAVMASATAVLAGVPWGKAAVAVFVAWILSRVVLIFLNLGQFVM